VRTCCHGAGQELQAVTRATSSSALRPSIPMFAISALPRPAPLRTAERNAESLRFVVCALPACRRVFFLCRYCDHGRRYCGAECARGARRASLDGARRRYQASSKGRRCHAERQRRYRERQREAARVTRQRPSSSGVPGGARASTPAGPTTTETPPPGDHRRRTLRSAQPVACARCGRLGRFLHHGTLAFAGRPERQRCFRSPRGA